MTQGAALATELAQAARMVAQVARGRSLTDEFDRVGAQIPQASRPALIDLTHATLRRYGRVQAIVQALSRHGAPEALVQALLWCALYALESGRYGEHTVVDQAVRACVLLERWTAKGYVNALLRRFLRERAAIEAELERDPMAKHQHPAWWIDVVRAAYPGQWRAALDAGNAHPPMGLRVNRCRADVPAYQRELAEQGIAAEACGSEALLLERALPVERLPGFRAGRVSVQDLGAQRAAHLLQLESGQRVLDACAAPGGKSAHMLELADVAVTALDIDERRAARIAPNLERLGLRAEIRIGDASLPEQWWDGRAYQRILADVPCSGSGVARRHPDVKWLRRASDIARFAERQDAILASLWRALAPGGKLLYATCSVFPQENEARVAAFVASEPTARRIALSDGAADQWLPDGQHDGFFYALIEKQL
jgi:16S rRNA (cytosine967-C5)-methyltransferase